MASTIKTFKIVCCFTVVFNQLCHDSKVMSMHIPPTQPFLSFVRVSSDQDFQYDQFGFSVANGSWFQDYPIQLELVDDVGFAQWFTKGYTQIVECQSQIIASGSNVTIEDTFIKLSYDNQSSSSVSFSVERSVYPTYISSNETIIGFSSRFGIKATSMLKSRLKNEFFMPSIRYQHSDDQLPSHALFGNLSADTIIVREDRLPFPLIMSYSSDLQQRAALFRIQPNGSTFTGEDFTKRIIDSRMQFGSIGIASSNIQGHTALVYQFPGSEGDRTYICCNSGWANRSHPFVPDFHDHRYNLFFEVSDSHSYADAVTNTWSTVTKDTSPVRNYPLPSPNQTAVFEASREVLARLAQPLYNGLHLVPFKVNLSTAEVVDTSSQMGFVGKALPCAAIMIQLALKFPSNDPDIDSGMLEAATAIIDFWVEQAVTTSGVVRTWFDSFPGQRFAWRRDSPYMGHVRIMSEGMRAVLQGFVLLQQRHLQNSHSSTVVEPELSWLDAAIKFGNFLVSKQNKSTGALFGEWFLNGTAAGNFTNVGHHADLAVVTGNNSFREAAVKLGRYAIYFQQTNTSFTTFNQKILEPKTNISSWYRYGFAGGACDNPNILDKEGGVLALQAFVHLHQFAPDEGPWLKAACVAGTYAATWIYMWDVPISENDSNTVYPTHRLGRTTLGQSIIATGQSGADNFMADAITAMNYISKFATKQDCGSLSSSLLSNCAAFLRNSTRQVMDYDGRLGYALRGLMNEAVTFAPPRGHGVAFWLPWLTAAILRPMLPPINLTCLS